MLCEDIVCVFGDVCVLVEDWLKIVDIVCVIIKEMKVCELIVEDIEVCVFFEWMVVDYFMFFGQCDYVFVLDGMGFGLCGIEGLGFGILCEVLCMFGVFDVMLLLQVVVDIIIGVWLIFLIKVNLCVMVYWFGYFDYVGVKFVGVDGKVVGECCFIGFYMLIVYMVLMVEILIVCCKCVNILWCVGFLLKGYFGKLFVMVFEIYLCDELFQVDEDQFYDIVFGILCLQEYQCMCLFVCCDWFDCFVLCFVFVLCDKYNIDLCCCIVKLLVDVYNGVNVEFMLLLLELVIVWIYFVVYVELGMMFDVDMCEFEMWFVQVMCCWQDDFVDVLFDVFGEE